MFLIFLSCFVSVGLEWHQFDGIAQPPTRFFQRVTQFIQGTFAQHHTQSVSVASASLPVWEGLCADYYRANKSGTAELALEAVRNVWFCIKFSFRTLHGALFEESFASDVSVESIL